jgi:putative YpdA family bacillithiol system oxidoreductase
MSDFALTSLIAALLILFTVVPYVLRLRRREREAQRRFDNLKVAGLTAATTMHPHIDALKCIGCGGCVRACPEGDVLAVIDGKATLVHGAKCVGHGLCGEACPVGAITLLMASPGRSADLPVLNENLETSVSGMFIAGELGGLGLIRNAITQGRMAVEEIGRRAKPGEGVAVVIVGAGPAGLAAALTAKNLGLNYRVLEQGDIGGTILQYPRSKIVMTSPVELPLWGKLKLTETSKESMLDLWNSIITRTELQVQVNEKVTNIQRCDGRFVIETVKDHYQASHVVLALGRRGTPRKLGVTGEGLSKVMYRLMDTESYKEVHALVVGGGDSAVEAALGLALQRSNNVTLTYRKSEFTRLKARNMEHLNDAIKRRTLSVLLNSQVREIRKTDVMLDTDQGPLTIRNDFVFIFAGGEMPYEFLKKIGVEFQAKVIQ